MQDEIELVVSGIDFAKFADTKLDVWLSIQGVEIHHDTYGTGTVQAIQPRNRYLPLIAIYFPGIGKTSNFNSDAFKSGKITSVELPDSLTDAFTSWRAEEAAQLQLGLLTKKYNVKFTNEPISLTPLLQILLKIDGGEILQDSEIKWLEDKSIYNVLATYHYRRYRTNENEPWALVKACRFLRKAGQPLKCVDLSAKLLQSGVSDSRVLGAAYTTMGGAYRDLGELNMAMTNAKQAINISPTSFHPYNLLGAICYEQGSPSEGDKYFEKAVVLGSSTNSQDAEIRAAFKSAELNAKKAIAQHLIKKDPNRYAWAKRFLNYA